MEEVSLRDLIGIIVKGKWLIIISTVLFTIIGIIVSFFFITPVYEAQTTFIVSISTNVTSANYDANKFLAVL